MKCFRGATNSKVFVILVRNQYDLIVAKFNLNQQFSKKMNDFFINRLIPLTFY